MKLAIGLLLLLAPVISVLGAQRNAIAQGNDNNDVGVAIERRSDALDRVVWLFGEGADAYGGRNYEQSFEAFQAALRVSRRIKYRQGEAHALIGLGAIYRDFANHPKAIEQYEASLLASREAKDQEVLRTSLNYLG
jgi:tetratricopeptide (TPR) repeat protein